MKTPVLIFTSAVCGFLGGLLGSRFVSHPQAPARNILAESIALRGANEECQLTSRGLSCWTANGSRAELTLFPLSVSVKQGEHRAMLGASSEDKFPNGFAGASFLLLDGKLYQPTKVDPVKLLAFLAATGQVDLQKVE